MTTACYQPKASQRKDHQTPVVVQNTMQWKQVQPSVPKSPDWAPRNQDLSANWRHSSIRKLWQTVMVHPSPDHIWLQQGTRLLVPVRILAQSKSHSKRSWQNLSRWRTAHLTKSPFQATRFVARSDSYLCFDSLLFHSFPALKCIWNENLFHLE